MKKKISTVLLASMISANVSPMLNVYANEVVKEKAEIIEKNVESLATITPFNLSSYKNFEEYNQEFRVLRNEIKSISNNGGQYSSSTIDKAIDGNLSTHWETGKANTSTFKNEVTFEFNDIETIDRIAYATRQDGAKGKGFPTEFEIYASVSGNDEDLKLVSIGTHTSTGNMMEFKFNTINAKKVKFVFKEANQGWASASEFWFYREDKTLDKLTTIFTDDNMNEVNEEFNTVEKLQAFENEAKQHPLYNDFKKYIDNAKLILEGNNVEYTDSIINKFKDFNDETLVKYNELFKVNASKITTNGGHYGSSNIEKAIDGDINTSWHSGKQNSDSHTNEVVITLDKLETLDRVVYSSLNSRGFAKAFDIYTSKTSDGDTFEKVTSGSMDITKNSMEIKFNPTEARRIKFVFKEGHENWALASEFAIYKQDIVKEKSTSIFTDNNKNVLSEDFNTLEKLENFENEAKNHPFYNDFKEDINNARLILEGNEVTYSDARITKFKSFEDETLVKYNELFKINASKISTNGGHYGSSNIEKAIDGDINTSWHSGKQNSDSHTNEVIITLDKIERLDRVVYSSLNSRGFAKAFDIYVSKTSSGDTFEKVTSGKMDITKDSMSIKFNPTEARRVKFVFKEGYENWALASEFALYKQDILAEEMETVFTNGLMDELSEAYNTDNALAELEKRAKAHPFYNDYKEIIERAKLVSSNQNIVKEERVVVGEQRGHYTTESGKRMVNGAAYSSFESFGKYVTAGEKIVVYVDADPNGKLPQLCFGQVGKGKGDWRRWVNLKPGRNEITVPENINPSAIYLVNQATSKEQAFAPRVRIEGGTKFPTYYHGETDPKEFRKELEEFAKKVNTDDTAFENGHPTDSVYNIAEFVSENVVITTTALGAIKGLEWSEKQDLDISDTMNEWEEMYDMFQTFMGLEKDAEEEKDSYFPNKFVARVFQNVPLGFADHGYTGYLGSANEERDGGFFSMIAAPPNMKGNDNWCYTHEFGHIFNTKYVVDGEVTNNLYAQEYRRINADKGINENRANWDEIFKRFKDEEVEYSMHYFERLAVLSQLNIAYGYDAYAKASKAVRDNTDLIKSIQGNDVQRLAVAYSLGLNVDLLDFFKGWNYANIEITEQMRDAVKDLPKLDKKIEYLHGGAYDYSGNGFTEDIKVNVNSNLNREENTITLNLSVDKNNQDDVLGYEVLKDGKVIGFTKTNSFTINNVNVDENVNYSVIAYAKDLSTAKEVEAQVLKPTLSIEENLTLQIGDKFDATKYVSATDYEGNSIENIEIEGSVDTSQKGEYKVKYTVTDSNITIEKTMNVKVVSKITYASDIAEVSSKVGWGSFRKDKAPNNTPIELDRQGLVAGYTKGLGTHANSEVVYNVENYDKFESYIGIDQSMRNNSSSSAKFIIYADGEKVFESGKFGSNTDHEFVSIDLNGVSELKLVTDSLGSNSADQTVWADAKFINNNTKPEIVANNSEYELGSEIDFMESVTAKDIEDGDLTSSIQIVSNNFEENKIGRFEVVYKVTDSDGNESQKSRYITVYETFDVKKSKYDSFSNLAQYNETFKIPVASIKNNAGNYGNSVISNAIDNNINTHWETNSPNNNNFKNEVVFDLGETNEISKMSYAARRGGKGFATAFSIYVSSEAEGNDFILAGKGSYTGNTNDVVEFDINDTTARRVKFVFDSARENWASMGEMSFYKKDVIADKVASMFTDSNKNEVTENYDTLEEIKSLREEAKNHPAYELLKADFDKAEEIVKLSFPTLNIPKSQSVKLGQAIDNLKGEFSATDTKDGDITSKVVVSGIENINFNKTGEYELTYSITDSDNNTVTKTRKISVVDMNDFNYLSDFDWKSANTGWGNINKDNSVSSNGLRLTDENGQSVSFEKGIGTHATSTIVYDLSDKNYARFTSYVGVDRAMYNSPGSIQFEVYVDGELVFDSKVMNAKDTMKFVDVDITDAKELKLVAKDGGNGNGSDHANWADAKMHFANNEGIEINKSTLDALVEELSNLNENLYTSESVEVVKATLEEVKASLNDGYNQSEIDSLVEKLTEAKNNLEIVIDKSELQQVIEYAKGLDISMVGANNHVEARWSNLLEAIDMANACLQDESKTQEDIDNAKIYLNYCISELYLK